MSTEHTVPLKAHHIFTYFDIVNFLYLYAILLHIFEIFVIFYFHLFTSKVDKKVAEDVEINVKFTEGYLEN